MKQCVAIEVLALRRGRRSTSDSKKFKKKVKSKNDGLVMFTSMSFFPTCGKNNAVCFVKTLPKLCKIAHNAL